MTKLAADQPCSTCGGLLVPPALASRFPAPAGTDYVCVNCGRLYRWTTSNPPLLTVLAAGEKERDYHYDDLWRPVVNLGDR